MEALLLLRQALVSPESLLSLEDKTPWSLKEEAFGLTLSVERTEKDIGINLSERLELETHFLTRHVFTAVAAFSQEDVKGSLSVQILDKDFAAQLLSLIDQALSTPASDAPEA